MKKPNILIIKHGALGDIIQADGVLKDIRAHHLNAHITLITTPAFQTLMQRCPHIDQVMVDTRAPFWNFKQLIQLRQQIKQGHFSIIYDFQNSNRTKIYRKFLLPQQHWVHRADNEKKPVSGLKGLVDCLQKNDIATKNSFVPNVSWMTDDVSILLNQHKVVSPFIALIPGCSAKHPEKRWPYYAKLATQLINNGYCVVSLLGPDERDLAGILPGHVLQSLSWFELAGVLNIAHYVIGNDTGPSHIASCLNKSGLAIFGPSTSAARSEIGRGLFKTCVVNNLHDLSVDALLEKITPNLAKI